MVATCTVDGEVRYRDQHTSFTLNEGDVPLGPSNSIVNFLVLLPVPLPTSKSLNRTTTGVAWELVFPLMQLGEVCNVRAHRKFDKCVILTV